MIEVRNLSKSFRVRKVLDNLTFDVAKGDVFGLIGPNGAGKTTLLRILATILMPNQGLVRIDGRNPRVEMQEVRRIIGYLPDSFGVYEELRVQEYLEFFASAYGLKGAKRTATVKGILELFDLTHKRNALIALLSRGMQQRVGLARVLIHDPQVLLLDEPASGLDPGARIEIRSVLKELRSLGKTILISSHILADLADLCNRIALIEKGRLLYCGGVKEALQRAQGDDLWLVEVFDDADRARQVLERQPFVESVVPEDGQLRVKLRPGCLEVHAIPQVLLQEGFRLKMFRILDATLEDAFLRLTEGGTS